MRVLRTTTVAGVFFLAACDVLWPGLLAGVFSTDFGAAAALPAVRGGDAGRWLMASSATSSCFQLSGKPLRNFVTSGELKPALRQACLSKSSRL